MPEDKHQRIAKEIKGLFAKEFGQFRLEDFNKVLEVIRTESFGVMPDFYEAYEKASKKDRDQFDFMMGLFEVGVGFIRPDAPMTDHLILRVR